MKKFLKKRISPLVAVLVLLIGVFALPASAYNFSSSEFSNLIVWSYAPETTINDVENYMDMITLQPNGMWHYSGQGGAKSFDNAVLADFVLPAGTYTISSNVYLSDARFCLYGFVDSNPYEIFTFSTASHTFESAAEIHLQLRIEYGYSDSLPDDYLWFMLNAGDNASPYVLPLNWVYKYDDFRDDSENYIKGELVASFNMSDYGVIDPFSSSALTAGQYYFIEDTVFCAVSGPDGDYAAPPIETEFTASTGRDYYVGFVDPSNWGVYTSDGDAPDSELTINIYVATYNVDTDASYTEEDINEAYQNGYDSGYSSGWGDGTSDYAEIMEEKVAEAYDEGFGAGYNDGYIEGKKEGITVSENGDWIGLMTAVVEAPVNTFQSLFNFNVLGLDMRVAFGSILTLCLLLIVIKKVLL